MFKGLTCGHKSVLLETMHNLEQAHSRVDRTLPHGSTEGEVQVWGGVSGLRT